MKFLAIVALFATLTFDESNSSDFNNQSQDLPAILTGSYRSSDDDWWMVSPRPLFCEDMKPERGPCDEHLFRWFYFSGSGACRRFDYSGCGGNENNFENENLCLLNCTISLGTKKDDYVAIG